MLLGKPIDQLLQPLLLADWFLPPLRRAKLKARWVAGADITLASPKGGQPPVDPRSEEPTAQTPATNRLKQDKAAQALLADTARLSTVAADDYDAVFHPGGHGPL